MLGDWLQDPQLDAFRAHHYRHEPYVQPGTAAPVVPLLDWESVQRLLVSGADLTLVRNGRRWPDPPPGDVDTSLELFRSGYSLVLRGCERQDAGLRALAASFADDLRGDVQVQVYATPGGFHSFGWHYDCEEVFIVQTSGIKEFRLRRNTVNPRPTLDAMPADMHFERETSAPVIEATLIAGDWLYIPRGWWHVGRALEDALSISIGVLAEEARGTRERVGRSAVHPRPGAAD
jgi:hypothetical protein